MSNRVVTLKLSVTVPSTVTDREIVDAINGALDEPPCDWQDWMVGAVTVTRQRNPNKPTDGGHEGGGSGG